MNDPHKPINLPTDRQRMIDRANASDDGCISAGTPLIRIIRDRYLTPEEVAVNNAVMAQVEQEFPPLKRAEKKMTKDQKAAFLQVIEELSNAQANAGCNDMELPNTLAIREMLADVADDKGFKEHLLQEKPGKTFVTYDWLVTSALKKFIKSQPTED